EGDLKLTRTILGLIQNGWSRFSQNPAASGIAADHNETLRSIVTGIQSSLEEFQTELSKYNVGAAFSRTVDNIRFSRQLQDLKQRLALHMSSLQLAGQQLILTQGSNVIQTLEVIQEGQMEQRWEDERQRGRQNQNRARRPRPLESVVSDDISSTVSSREFLIDRWRREVPSGLDSILEPESLFLDNEPPQPAMLPQTRPMESIPPAPLPHIQPVGEAYLTEVPPGPPSPGHQGAYTPYWTTTTTATASNHQPENRATTPKSPSEPGTIQIPDTLGTTDPAAQSISPSENELDGEELFFGFAVIALIYMILFTVASLVLSGYLFGKEADGSWDAPHSNSMPTLIISCLELPIMLVVLTQCDQLRRRTIAALYVACIAALGSGIWLVHDTRMSYKKACNEADAGRDCGQATKIRFAIGSMQILIGAFGVYSPGLLFGRKPKSPSHEGPTDHASTGMAFQGEAVVYA
ncbi:hypothetical protein B0T10DRAFT_501871, partial [Thelonectria olida]